MNYSAFDTNYSAGDSVQASLQRLKLWFGRLRPVGKFIYALVFIYLVSSLSFLFFFSIGGYLDTNNVLFLFFGLVILAMVVFLAYQLFVTFGRRILILQRFAADNGFEFRSNFFVPSDKFILFRVGLRQHQRNAVVGTFDGKSIAVFDYRFTKGSARHPAPVIFTVVGVNTGESFPHTVLINKNSRYGNLHLKSLPEVEDAYLSQSFNVWSDGSLANAKKSVLHPDAVSALLQLAPCADIEISGDQTYMYLPGTLDDAKSFERIFAVIKSINS